MIRMVSLLLAFTISSYADTQIRIGVLDTGLDLKDPRFEQHLCKDGHNDFTEKGMEDVNGHGTHVAGLITQYAKGANFCLVILKYYHDTDDQNSLTAYRTALSKINSLKLDFVNYSSGGIGVDLFESENIKKNKQITFVVAAGNDNKNLDVEVYYPASYNFKNIVVVGALGIDNKKLEMSNYGKLIDYWDIGENVYSTLPKGRMGWLNGTSMSTAIRTGKLVKEKYAKSH
jgi:major intracellular serine protease